MKTDGAWKHFVLAFLLAVSCYALFYRAIEHRRERKGPWEVTFTSNSNGVPLVAINQPRLAITNAQISFPEQPEPPANTFKTLIFGQAQQVPFDVPFGKCVFMDTTFLPGTLTFELYGHEIELLPRVLIIDHQEHPWLSESSITLHPVQTNSVRFHP
jgi:hypothetical protein